ncbi:tetratricopeptide repeat protein [Sulfitobacter sp. JBTF-M27]|uniref:Tetratricopeptide repeat protein n=1 Tax=Sulfitobacter sediminilitoris TaxID=2698830 RepID=A0A6P0CEC8_9RHOB|nr:adenylate/guanylate cyclase domain-containing protein [Sulfitobacter sediminilitoris]NEK24541.1 tetratricopeptide repeat protein [Sulfitobacter sediminilitoris]
MDKNRQTRKLITILSADVVGYSSLMSSDESGTLAALQKLRRIDIDPRIARHNGRTVKLMGDGSLIEFSSVVDAVLFAVDVQHAIAKAQSAMPDDQRIRFRIGINVGDVIVDREDIYGDGVNVAARIEGLAEPGGICISRAVFDQVNNKLDLTFAEMGPQKLKNLSAPVEVYKVELDARSQALAMKTPPQITEPQIEVPRSKARRWVLAAAIVVIALSSAMYFLRPEASEPPVIAVLPFEDFSSAEYKGSLSDAVSGGIITSLARFPQMKVISRRSSFKFRDSDLRTSEIADQLGADFILEGTQQYDGKRLQITAQLIDGETEAHIWADEVDVPLEDLLRSNNAISLNVAESVGNKVIETEVARMTKDDVSALMIANAAQSRIMRDFSRESLLKNIEEQERSLRDYPDSAWGYLGQALSLRIGLRYGWIEGDEEEIRKRMYDLARRGVELDPNNFMAYQALGRALTMNNNPEAAANAFRRAIELNPSSSFARTSLAQTLGYIGETEEALEVITEAELVDPFYGHDIHWEKARIQWQMGECDESLETFQSSPSIPIAANKMLAAIHHCLGNADKAAQVMAVYVAENPSWTVSRERDVNAGLWIAPGVLDRWLEAMKASGMPL